MTCLRARGLRDRSDLRIETCPHAFGRSSLVPRAHDGKLPHVGLRVALALTERADRLLDLLGVLDEVRTKTMQAKAHIHGEQLLHRGPLRGTRELRCVGRG